MAILPPSLQGIRIYKPMNEGLPREADTCHNSLPLAFSLNQCPLHHYVSQEAFEGAGIL